MKTIKMHKITSVYIQANFLFLQGDENLKNLRLLSVNRPTVVSC